MKILYTARAKYSELDNEGGLAWEKYIKWSRLTHLTELVSLDMDLNEVLVEPDRDSDSDWEHIVVDGCYETGFFSTLDFVLQKTRKKERVNVLAVIIEPTEDCAAIQLDNFYFLGYELLDQSYDTSALTNCGGFDETFQPADLNRFGLVDEYQKAFDIKQKLLENNPEEWHADTNVIAVWRHQLIG